MEVERCRGQWLGEWERWESSVWVRKGGSGRASIRWRGLGASPASSPERGAHGPPRPTCSVIGLGSDWAAARD
jgi:hypothetical protein